MSNKILTDAEARRMFAAIDDAAALRKARKARGKMKHYKIAWFIDVEATSPLAAAREALVIQRDPESVATIFTVQDADGSICVDADTGDELPSDFPGFWCETEPADE